MVIEYVFRVRLWQLVNLGCGCVLAMSVHDGAGCNLDLGKVPRKF